MPDRNKSKLHAIYDAMNTTGDFKGSASDFNSYFNASGEQGYKNRKAIYDTLSAGGADVGASYEEFAKRIGLHAVQKPQPTTKPKPLQTQNESERYQALQDLGIAPTTKITGGHIGVDALQHTEKQADGYRRDINLSKGHDRFNLKVKTPLDDLIRKGKAELEAQAAAKESAYKVAETYGVKDKAKDAWAAADALSKKAQAQNDNAYRTAYAGAPTTAAAGGSFMQDATNMAIHLQSHDLERMAKDAWNRLGKGKQNEFISNLADELTRIYPNADPAAIKNQASRMAREEIAKNVYNVAVENNTPKSALEGFMRTAINQSAASTLLQSAARSMAGTTGDMGAREDAEQRYANKHKVMNVAGTVAGMAADPLMQVSGGVGGAAVEGATAVAGKAIGKAATRKLASTLGGRLAAGAIGGAANFGTFEAGGEALDQMKWGGYTDKETGERVEGFSLGNVVSRFGHGLTMGAASGVIAPTLGNVSDKLVRATGSTIGKMGIRAGELGVGTVAEGTIFSIPEWIEGDRDAMDVWTDNMAMMAGFKGQHLLKSAPSVIGALAASKKGKVGFETRLRSVLDGRDDLALTKDEKEELSARGYDDLKKLTEEYGKYAEEKKKEGAKVDGDNKGKATTDTRKMIARELPYNRFTELMNDNSISEAARAKMYYYLTGHTLPMSTVMGSDVFEIKDAEGNVSGYNVQSFGANGVITNRTFSTKERAGVEVDRIDRQAELNGVDVGERRFDWIGSDKRMAEAVAEVAEEYDVSPSEIYDLMKRKPDTLSGIGKTLVDAVSESYKGLGDKYGSSEVRAEVNKEFGVNVDKAIRKERNRRSKTEQDAVDEYIQRLYDGVKREQEDTFTRDDAPNNPNDPNEQNRETSWDGNGEERGNTDTTEDTPTDGRVEEVKSQVDSRTNTDSGMVEEVYLKEDSDKPENERKKYYVKSGTLAVDKDGNVKLDESEQTIVVTDEDGNVRMISPKEIAGAPTTTDPVQLVEEATTLINEENSAEQVRTNDSNPQFGDSVTLTDAKGNVIRGTINDVRESDSTVEVITDDGRVQRIPVDDFLAGVQSIERDGNRVFERSEEESNPTYEGTPTEDVAESQTQPREYALNEELTLKDEEGNYVRAVVAETENEDGLIEVASDTPINGRSVNLFTREELDKLSAPTEENTVVSEQTTETTEGTEAREDKANRQPTPLELVPRNENGEPIFEQAESPEVAWDALVEFSGGDADTAKEIADAMTEEKRKALDKAQKLKLKGKTPTEMLASKQANAAELAKAESEYNHWVRMALVERGRQNDLRTQIEAEARRLAEERAEAEKAERAAREEAERKGREALEGVPDWVEDTPSDARARGFRRSSGAKYDRQEPIQTKQGKEVEVKFSDDVKQKGHAVAIDASQLQPSHMDGRLNVNHFIPEAQPKQRTDAASRVAADKIASNINPEEITSMVTAYTGAPVVNARGEVIQGNNRSAALKIMWESHKDQGEKYKQYLIDHAEEFGLSAEDISKMENPVLVRMTDVTDERAIELGQYTASDTESGGTERIKPQNAVQKMGEDMSTFASLLLRSNDEEASLAQLLDTNGATVLEWMQQKGYITPTQYKSAFDTKGNLTAEAVNDLKGVMYQSIFKGGNERLEDMFNNLPAKAQKAILATAFRDNDSARSERMLGEIQNSIMAYNDLLRESAFATAKSFGDARMGIEMWKNQYQFDDATGESYLPTEKYSNFALHLAAMYKGDTQSLIQATFNQLYDLIQGRQKADLFNQDTLDNTPRTMAEAIKEVLHIDYDGPVRSNVLGGNLTPSKPRESGSSGTAETGERSTRAVESSERRGRVDDIRGGGRKSEATAGERRNNEDTGGRQPSDLAETPKVDYKLSDEVDENGRQFVLAPDGNLSFGEIDASTGLTQAPILLSEGIITNAATNDGYGLVHIEARHGEQIRKAGYKSVLDFIVDVAKNYETIKEGSVRDGNQTYMLQLHDKHNNTLMVELSGDGTYWNINTAGIFKTSYGNNRKEVYNRHTTAKQSAETAETSRNEEQSGTTSSPSMSVSTPPNSKGTEVPETKQEKGDKKPTATEKNVPTEERTTSEQTPYTIEPTSYTNKKGKTTPMHLVTFGRELTTEEKRAGKELAKESRGWWDSKQGGFMMRSEEAAKELAEMLAKGDKEAIADAQPLSVEDMKAATVAAHLQATKETTQEKPTEDKPSLEQQKQEQPKEEQSQQEQLKEEQPKEEKKSKSKYVNDEDAERFEELRARLRKKLSGQMNMGVDPEIFAIGVEMSYLMLKKGARKINEFAKNLIDALGEEVRPYVKAFYNGARELPEMADYEKDMTPYEEVRRFDVKNFDKEGTADIFDKAKHVAREQEAEREAKEAEEKLKAQRNEQRRETRAKEEQGRKAAKGKRDWFEKITKELKEKYPDAIIIIKDGDKNSYCAVGDDAALVSEITGTPVKDGLVHIVGSNFADVPKSVIKAGHRVALVEGKIDEQNEKKEASGGSSDIVPEPQGGKQNGTAPLQSSPSESKGSKNTREKSVTSQEEQLPSLFGDMFDNEESGTDTPKSVTSKTEENEQEVHLRPRAEEPGRGGQQSRHNESLGESAAHENERTDGRGVARRGGGHTMSDPERSERIPQLSKSEQHVNKGKNVLNNHAERGTDYAPKGERARIDANLAAIELAKYLLASGATASTKEMEVLRRYSGWGGLGAAFYEGTAWAPNPINVRLRNLLTPEEYEAAEMSRNSAYYTPAPIIDAMWDIAKALGFKGGNILEGSAGIGNIIGLMPSDISEHSNIHAVEIDDMTGGILSLLYPDANVDIQGFEKTRIPNGSVDIAITNVPFVTGLHVMDESGDGDLSKKFRDIHDFCIAKNVRKLREGGIGIFISSSGTLDKSQKLRNWLVGDKDGCADVVGVFRMNNQTFNGTAATSDIIIVRKRVNGRKSANAIDVSTVSPMRTATFKDDSGKTKDLPLLINRYFMEHPEDMGGEMHFGFEKGDTYRPTSIGLYPSRETNQAERMTAWVERLANKDWSKEQGTSATEQTTHINEPLGKGVKEGNMLLGKDGKLCVARGGRAVPLEISNKKIKGRTKEECFKDYAEIKDALADVLKYQTEHEDNAGLQPLLDRLNNAYDTFVERYGHLNKNNNLAWLRNDVDFSSTVALESYSEKGSKDGKRIKTYSKTDVFNRRVVEKESELTPKNVKDGIIASIYEFGRIDPEYIAEKLGKKTADVKKEILDSGLGFVNPTTGQTEVLYEYLSGNVREKLRQAKEANEAAGGAYASNIKALEAVLPMDIPAHLIEFALGSSWIDPKFFERYIEERTGLEVKLTNVGGTWSMKEPFRTDTPKNEEMGIRSTELGILVPGHKLIEAAITNKTITISKTIKDYYGGTRTVTDPAATTACATKIDEIRQDFKDWARAQMQADPDLSNRMEKVYNEQFNNSVPKIIPKEFIPSHFSGAATMLGGKEFQLRPHQAQAVVRSTTQPVLLAHEVGTGKTYTLITTAMEMRRLGTARKPMIVVQNATVGQFVASAKALYPNAKVLTLEDADRTAEGRKAFYAKIKFNDWDMIVVPQSVFERIPDSIERQTKFIQDKIDEKMHTLEIMKVADPRERSMIIRAAKREIDNLQNEIAELAKGGTTGKKKEKDAKKASVTRQNAEVKAKEMLERDTDDVEDFDSMGIDAVLVDEAHEYKHLGFPTAMQRGVKGVDSSYSKKSQGVFLKTQAVLEKTGGKNVVFATGTPISNTAAEIWTFMRYLMPADMMKDYGIYYFDDFVRNFGNLQQMMEFTTSGKYKEVNRFAGYVNLPELVRIWSTIADTVLTRDTGEVLDKIPKIEGGKAQDIYLPQTRGLRSIMKFVKAQLDEYDKMSGKEKKENSHIPLTMYGIAKAAAVDARLVQADAPDDPKSKTNEAVRQTLRSLKDTKDYRGTVAIFADNYQNKASGFNLYEDIRKKLIDAGVPAEQIVIIKSGMSVNKKLDIFSRVNSGDVRVIMGSTFTLGTGVNVQERLHTLIHLDAPNRPMDYTQRNGRILRQGNQHKEWNIPVRILRFGVEDSLDVTAYQRLKTKGAIADSIMNGKELMKNSMENRSFEEEQDIFGDITAQLSGSEYAMLKNQMEKEVRKLTAKQKNWEADQTYIHNHKRKIAEENKAAEKQIANNEANLAKVEAATNNKITVGKRSFSTIDEMEDFFAEQNKKKIELQEKVRKNGYSSRPVTSDIVVSVGGFDFNIHTEIKVETKQQQGSLFYSAPAKMTYSCTELGIGDMPVKGNVIKNAVKEIMNDVISGNDFRERIDVAKRTIERNNADLQSMAARDGVPFQHTEELAKAKEKLAEYEELMKKEMEAKEAKYAEMDKGVEAASGIELTAEDDGEYADNKEVKYHRGNVEMQVTPQEQALLDAVTEQARKAGIEVVTDVEEGQRVLDMADGDVTLSRGQKRALETASVSQDGKHQQTVISSADGAKVLNNLDSLASDYEKSQQTKEKTFLGEIAKALGAQRHGSTSQYATFETKNGNIVTIRFANHNARVSTFDSNGEAEGISIVVSPKKNAGMTNDGVAHVVEYYYDAIKLRRSAGKPLAEIVRSIKQALYSGEFKDTTGLAQREEVNADRVREHRVYHGSGADFDHFDHSHMGEGEGAQAYGWGTSGGRSDGASNYVIFNEADAKITDHVRFFKTSNGEAYGYTIGGKIYVDPRIATAETPIHEYGHLWAEALRNGNPEEWENVVGLMKGTSVWNEVKKQYPELKTDHEIADEVIALYSGRRGAERLREEQRKIAKSNSSVTEKAAAIGALEKVKQALKKFWKGVADFLHIHFTSAEEVADRVLKDLLDGVNPNDFIKGKSSNRVRKQFIGEKGARAADHAEEVTTRLDNLNVAREMEEAKKDAKTIKLATGWERGADGKWRYEVEDAAMDNVLKRYAENQKKIEKLKNTLKEVDKPFNDVAKELYALNWKGDLTDSERKRQAELQAIQDEAIPKRDEILEQIDDLQKGMTLEEALGKEHPVLIAYPSLRETKVEVVPIEAYYNANYDWNGTIRINEKYINRPYIKTALAHEVQHAIQQAEGFATGGNEKNVRELIRDRLSDAEASKKAIDDMNDALLQASRLKVCREWLNSPDEKLRETAIDWYWEAMNNIDNDYSNKYGLVNKYENGKSARDIAMSGYHIDEAIAEFQRVADEYGEMLTPEEYAAASEAKSLEEALKESDSYKLYFRLGGEVEARNVQRRMGMTAEARRQSLASDTEDVSREDQIFLFGDDGTSASLAEQQPKEQRIQSDDVAAQSEAEDPAVYRLRDSAPPKKTKKCYKLMRLGADGKLYPLFIDAAAPTELNTWYDADSPNLAGLKKLPSGVHLVDNITGKATSYDDFFNNHKELFKNGKMGKYPTKEAIKWATDNGARFIYIEDTPRAQKRFEGESRKYWNLGINGSGTVSTFSMRPGWHAGTLPTMRQIGKGKNKDLRDDRFVWVEGEVSADKDYNAEAQRNPDHDMPDRIPEDGFYMKATNADAAKSQADKVGWFVAGSFKANRILSDSEARKVIDDWNAAHPDKKVEYDYEREGGKVFDAEKMQLVDKDDMQQDTDMKRKTAEQMAEKLNTPVHIIDDAESITHENPKTQERRRRAKGWYDTRTGEVTIVLSNHSSAEDVAATVVHETIAHKGLREMVGEERYDEFLDETYNHLRGDLKKMVDEAAGRAYFNDVLNNGKKAKSREQHRRKQVDELFGRMAEKPFEEFSEGERTLWQTLKSAVRALIDKFLGTLKLPKWFELGDNELRYILWRSKENLGKGILDKARDTAKREELGLNRMPDVTDVREGSTRKEIDAGDNVLFRDGDPEEHERGLARARYEHRVNSGWFQTREAFQDSMAGLEEGMTAILKSRGEWKRGKHIEDVPDYENPYIGENRLSSVNQDEANEVAKHYFRPLYDEVKKLAKNAKERAELTDYMMAKHGLERNEVMAQRAAEKQNRRDYAGLTALTGIDDIEAAENEARAMVEAYESSHDTQALWDKVNAANAYTLEKTYKCGLISKQTYDDVSKMYNWYIPLRGFDEQTAEDTYAYLEHRDSMFNSPIKTAKGRKSKADDPFANMEAMAESAIMQGNRNTLIGQRALNFALNHPSDLVSVSKLWLHYDAPNDEWRPVFPDNISETDTATEVERKMQDFEARMQELQKKNPDEYKSGSDTIGIPYRVVSDRNKRQHQVIVKRNGVDYVLTINGNPRMAQALNGQTNPDYDRETLVGQLMNKAQKIQRLRSKYATQRNISFSASNFVRDLIYSNTMAWVKANPAYAARFNANALRCNPFTMGHLISKDNRGVLDMSKPIEKLYNEFMRNGGDTGFLALRGIEERKSEIQKILSTRGWQKNPFTLLGKCFDYINMCAENSARFAAYMTSRQSGRTVGRSIWDAKEASVNFNKKGAGERFNGQVGQTKAGNFAAAVSGAGRQFFMFWNAAVQGSFGNFFKNVGRHPIKAASFAILPQFSLGFLLGVLGYMNDDDDDKNKYADLPLTKRRQNACIKVGGQWITIPLPPELRVFYGLGELAASAAFSKKEMSDGEIAMQIAEQFTQLLPLDFLEGRGGLHAFVPSFAAPISEVASNTSWTGLPIYKESEFNKYDPEWTKAYKSANKQLVDASKWLNEQTGGDEYTKGTIDINPAQIEYLLNSYFSGYVQFVNQAVKTGETATGTRSFEWRNIPVANRLLTTADERTENRALTEEYFKLYREYERTENRYNGYKSSAARGNEQSRRDLEQLANSDNPEFVRYVYFKEYLKPLKQINDAMKQLPEDDPQQEQLKAVRSQIRRECVERIKSIEMK